MLDALADAPGAVALVLASARTGVAGPLVGYFVGDRLAGLPCPLILIPGALAPRDIAELA